MTSPRRLAHPDRRGLVQPGLSDLVRSTPTRLTIAALSCLVLAGCSQLHLQAEPPKAPTVPSQFSVSVSPATSPRVENTPVERPWWHGYGDDTLNRLVEQALSNNRELAIAQSRIDEARAQIGVAAARGLPELDVGVDFVRDKQVLPTRNAVTVLRPITSVQRGWDMTWEVDVFGAIARSRDAAAAEMRAIAADRDALALRVGSEVIRSYWELRSAQAQERNLNELLNAVADLESVVAARHRAGLTAGAELLRAQEQLALTRTALPELRERQAIAVRQLAVLLGQTPGSLVLPSNPTTTLPVHTLPMPDAVPASLLQQRPDLRAAEQRWAAALQGVAQVKAERLPSLNLTAALGVLRLFGLPRDYSSPLWKVSGQFGLPLYDPSFADQLKAQTARARQGELQLENAVNIALLEVEDSVIRFNSARERAAQWQHAHHQAREQRRVAQERWQRGLSDAVPVLELARQELSHANAWLGTQQDVLNQQVALFKALGSAPIVTP